MQFFTFEAILKVFFMLKPKEIAETILLFLVFIPFFSISQNINGEDQI